MLNKVRMDDECDGHENTKRPGSLCNRDTSESKKARAILCFNMEYKLAAELNGCGAAASPGPRAPEPGGASASGAGSAGGGNGSAAPGGWPLSPGEILTSGPGAWNKVCGSLWYTIFLYILSQPVLA